MRVPGLKAHVANSAGTLGFPQMHLNFVRTGLLLYGVYPTFNPPAKILDLQPALTWKTRIAFVKSLPAGMTVSYGRTWKADAPTNLAVLPVGYGDGYTGRLSNCGKVLFRGQYRPVIGTVCMNHAMIDLGDEAGVHQGEEVVLIGEQEGKRITANHLADWANSVPHEILARLSPRLARRYK
jgi:alanine racemase